MASHLYMTHIFPVFSLFVALEEDPHLLAMVSAGGALPSTEGAGNLNQQAVLDPHQIQVLLAVFLLCWLSEVFTLSLLCHSRC